MASDPVLIARIATLPFECALESIAALAPLLENTAQLSEQVDAEAAKLEALLYAAAGPREDPSPMLEARGSAVATATARTELLSLRRAVHHRRRSVLLEAARDLESRGPEIAAELRRHLDTLHRLDEHTTRLRVAHDRELAAGAHRLLAMMAEPIFEQGIRLVSRTLFEKAKRLEGVSFHRWKHRERHTALKLAAYLARAASKTSPNGVFCATTLARLSDRAACSGENTIAALDVLLAVGESRKITACLAAEPALQDAVIPHANPTLQENEGLWTFWRAATAREDKDEEVKSTVRIHPVASALLESCDGVRNLEQVLEHASARTGVAPADLAAFARKLSNVGLLIAEVEIPWSERRPLRRITQVAQEHGIQADWVDRARDLEASVDRVAATPWPERRALLDRVSAAAEGLPHHRSIHHDELVRVDAASALDISLPRPVTGELQRFMSWYARLFGAMYPRQRFVENHAERFLARFPADTDVSLLDLYHGIFEPRGESRPTAFPTPSGADPLADRARRAHAKVRELLIQAARRAGRDGGADVALDALDWEPILGDVREPRWSCGVLFQVAAADAAAIDAGGFRLVLNGLYAGGGLAVARLAHLHSNGSDVEDGPLAREIRDTWSALGANGEIVAEISYMHGGRTANAGLRPSLFRHEIVLPGDQATPGREIIPLHELAVRFESGARRFRLRWTTRGVDVRPIVSSGISPEGLVAFLIAVGQQDLQPLALFPGFEADDVDHWPRFRFGRVVLFRRRWTLPLIESPFTPDIPALDARRMLEVARWRRRHGISRHVFVHSDEDPKPSCVDLESPWLVETLVRRLVETPPQTLSIAEMDPDHDHMWIRDERGRYASEFLLHLRSDARGAASA